MRADTNNKFIQYWCEFGCNFCFSSLLKDDNNDGVDDENQRRRRRKKLKIKQHKQTMTLTQYDSIWLWVNSAIISFPSVMNACFQFHIVSVKQTTNTLIRWCLNDCSREAFHLLDSIISTVVDDEKLLLFITLQDCKGSRSTIYVHNAKKVRNAYML